MSSHVLTVTNPYTGETIGEVNNSGADEVCSAVASAQDGVGEMRKMPAHRRAELLQKTSELLRSDTASLGNLISRESGKTIREARAEVQRAADIFQIAGEEARRLHGETIPFDALSSGVGRTGYWTRVPVGIVGAITPWNVPLALSAHKIAPALASGNAVIHKPAEQTPLNAIRLHELMLQAGLPPNAIPLLTGDGESAGDLLVRHAEVGFISFTGSRAVGMALPARAGFKRVALELGGNSPVIITQTANIEEAVTSIVRGGFAVAGQLCISVQRVLVHISLMRTMLDALADKISQMVTGDPINDNTDMGCLIDSEACDRVERLVEAARTDGATVVMGGTRQGRSTFAPTLITDIRLDGSIATEEAFGPIIALIPFGSLDEAIEIANSTQYGLNAGIFTSNLCEAAHAGELLDAGTVLINDVPTFRSDIMPYGGRKQSGLGREGVRFAMEEMTETKVICTRTI